MSTLRELRLTLDEHAEGLHDTEHVGRSAAVHRRVRVVRRRRTAAVAVAAVVAIVATAVVTQTLRTPSDPVPAENWHGVDVPTEVELAAGTYDLDEIQDVKPGKELSLPYPEDERIALSLVATGLGDGSATLVMNGVPWIRLVGGHELSPPIEAFPFTLEIELDGAPAGAEVGFARYRGPSDGLPQGEGHAEPAYLERVDDRVLADWASAGPGETAEVTVRAPLEEITIAPLCSADAGEVVMSVDADELGWGVPCDQQTWGDGTTNVTYGSEFEAEAAEEHTIRVSATDPGVGVSVGVYVRGDGPEILGQQVAETVEFAGRTWTLDEVIDQDGAPLPLSAEITTTTEDRLVQFVNAGGGAEATFDSGLGEPCEAMGTQGVSDFCNPILLAGDTHHIEVTGYTASTEAAILVYRPE